VDEFHLLTKSRHRTISPAFRWSSCVGGRNEFKMYEGRNASVATAHVHAYKCTLRWTIRSARSIRSRTQFMAWLPSSLATVYLHQLVLPIWDHRISTTRNQVQDPVVSWGHGWTKNCLTGLYLTIHQTILSLPSADNMWSSAANHQHRPSTPRYSYVLNFCTKILGSWQTSSVPRKNSKFSNNAKSWRLCIS
jgi:hypothetical protein